MDKRASALRLRAADAIRIALTAIALTALTEASAANYAVLQLVSGKLTIVSASTTTGSRTDRNEYETHPFADALFDDALLSLTGDALRAADASASVRPIRVAPDQARALQERYEQEADPVVHQLVAVLKGSKDVAPDTLLLLVVPRKMDLSLQSSHGHFGTGRAAGFGFYVDRITRMYRTDTHEYDRGFLGPFVNVQVLAVSVADDRIVGDATIATGTTRALSRSPDNNVWNALSNEEKIVALKALYKEAIDRAVAEVLKSQAVK